MLLIKSILSNAILIPQHIDSLSTDRHFDLICANLPYIPTEKLYNLPIYGREPTLALDGGADGLDPFRKLFKLGAGLDGFRWQDLARN